MRAPLPTRRLCVTDTIVIEGMRFHATAGVDPHRHAVVEVFLNGAKEGSDTSRILADCAVVISIALQSGVPLHSLRKSVGRIRNRPLEPAELDGWSSDATRPASVIGATLDFLVSVEKEVSGVV